MKKPCPLTFSSSSAEMLCRRTTLFDTFPSDTAFSRSSLSIAESLELWGQEGNSLDLDRVKILLLRTLYYRLKKYSSPPTIC